MILFNVLKRRRCIIQYFEPRDAVKDFKFKAVVKEESNSLYVDANLKKELHEVEKIYKNINQ